MKINRIFAALAVVALAGGFASCSDDDNEYAPAAPVGNAEVYFERSQATTVNLEEGQNEIEIPLYRVAVKDELTVKLAAVNPTGLFNVPATVTFPAESNEATLKVTFDFNAVEGQVDYILTLNIDQEQASPYGLSSITLHVSYAPWSEWERVDNGAVYTLAVAFSGTMSYGAYFERHSLLDENNVQYGFQGFLYNEDEMFIIGRNLKTNDCYIPMYYTGFDHEELGKIYVVDGYSINPSKFAKSKFDPTLGLFTLNNVWCNEEYRGWTGTETLQLDGFADFTVTMGEGGHYIDAGGLDHIVITATWGEDVSKIRYVLLEGIPTEEVLAETISKIKDEEIEAQELTAPGAMAFQLETRGKYTVVALAYNEEGKAVSYDTFTFTYRPLAAGEEDPNADWTSLGYCRYTDDTFLYMFMEEGAGVPCVTYSVEIQESKLEAGVYRLVNPYGAAFPFNEPGDYDSSENHYVVINAADPAGVYIEQSETSCMWDPSAGAFGLWSMADYFFQTGQGTRDQIKAAGYCGKLENSVITFPAETLICTFSKLSNMFKGNCQGKWKVDMSDLTAEPGEPEQASAAAVSGRSFRDRGNGIKWNGVRYHRSSPIDMDRYHSQLRANPVCFR